MRRSRPTAQRVLAHTLDALLRLLHPIIPFVTEEIWQLLAEAAPVRGVGTPTPAAESIMIAPWPEADLARQNGEIEARFARFQEVLRAIRDIRTRQNVPPRKEVEFLRPLRCGDGRFAAADGTVLCKDGRRARATGWGPDVLPPELSANVALTGMEVFVDLAELIDVARS